MVPGHEGALSYVAGAPLLENLHRFVVYTLLTSTGSWDTGRAITNRSRSSCSARRSSPRCAGPRRATVAGVVTDPADVA